SIITYSVVRKVSGSIISELLFLVNRIDKLTVGYRYLSFKSFLFHTKRLTFATLFGIASSSCSYAAVALARSIFVKGASFTAAMVFELASTNLVIELGIILIILMGWQFAAAEFVGGILMVIFIALIFRLTLTPELV